MTLSFGGSTMPSFSLLYLRLCAQKHTSYSICRVFIARTSIYYQFIININIYSSAMRRLCLSGFRLVAPPVAHNQGERQQVATFIANNLAVFQQRVSAVLEASQR